METLKSYILNQEILLESTEPEHLYFTSIKFSNKSNTTTFTFKADDAYKLRNYAEIKDSFFYKAVDNLIKKTEFLQLYIQLAEGQITEEEYEEELEENSDKYFIDLNPIESERHFKVLIHIIQKFQRRFSVDEATEIFGISTQSILEIKNR